MNRYRYKKKKRHTKPFIDICLYEHLLTSKNIVFDSTNHTILFIRGQMNNPETKGGCMFLAVLATLELLGIDDWSVSKLRQIIYHEVTEHPFDNMNEEELQDFLDNIVVNGTWGGDEALSAIATALNVNFYVMVYYKDNEPYIHEVLGSTDEHPTNGFLIWSNNHYDAFVKRNSFSRLLDGLYQIISSND